MGQMAVCIFESPAIQVEACGARTGLRLRRSKPLSWGRRSSRQRAFTVCTLASPSIPGLRAGGVEGLGVDSNQ